MNLTRTFSPIAPQFGGGSMRFGPSDYGPA